MKMKKVLTSLFLSIVVFSAFAFNAGAENHEFEYRSEVLYEAGSSEIISSSVDVDALKKFLRENLPECPDYLDLTEFGIPEGDSDAVYDLVWDLLPDMFHVGSMGVGTDGGIVTTVGFNYVYDEETFKTMHAQFLAEAEKLLDGVKGNDSLSDVEKALLLHDRIIANCEYDTQNEYPREKFMSYGALVNNKAVCQGYAEAYLYLLEQVGIDSRLCESKTLNHAWNIITIGGKEYHVDVTWDDPTKDIIGRVYHDNFLRSSDGIYASGHTATDFDTTPSDTKYDAYFWQNSETSFQLLGEEIYYIDNTNKAICTMSDNMPVHTVSDVWYAGATSYWSGNFSRLASDGQTLLYNLTDAVYSYDVTDGTVKKIWEPDLSAGGYYNIFGFTYSDGYLIAVVNDTPNFNVDTNTKNQQKYLYDGIAPTVTSTVTNNVSETQTVTLDVTENNAVAGYYWSADSTFSAEEFTATSSEKIEIPVSDKGTYYYAVQDASGNISETGKLIFYKVTLDAQEGSVALAYITALKGNTVTLPAPARDNYNFLGWALSPSSSSFSSSVTVNRNYTYYAVWQEILTVSGIEIYSEPYKTEYYIGDSFDPAGLRLKATYSSGSSAYVSDGFTVTGFDSSSSGTVTLTVDYMGVTETFDVTIKTPSVTLSANSVSLDINATATLAASAVPSGVTVSWTSSDYFIASVANGVIKGKNEGSATVTATIVYNGISYTATCEVSVACLHSKTTVHNAVASTCLVQGNDAYTVCDVCGDVISGSDELLPFAGHDYIKNAHQDFMIEAATCVSAAKYYKSCSECGQKSDEIFSYGGFDSENHPETELRNKKNATCSEKGYTGDTHCTECSALIKKGVDIAKESHTSELVKGYDATCTRKGLSNGEKCSVCHTVLKEQTELDMIPHDYEKTVTAPTCTAKGYTTYKCYCGNSYVSDHTDMAAHTPETVKGYEPTCTKTGLTDGEKCLVCGVTLSEQKEIAVTAHDYKKLVTEPTCTSAGYTVYTCDCGNSYVGDNTDPVAHISETVRGYAATCTSTGLTDGAKCSECGTVLKEQTEIGKTGHIYKTSVTAPTCSEQGYTTYLCSCGENYRGNYTAKSAHTPEIIRGQDATCTQTGLTDGAKCSVCGVVLSEQKVVEKTGHIFVSSVITSATCDEQGYTTYTCTCGYSEKRNCVDAAGHSFGEWTVETEATTENAGSMYRECSVCGEKETQEIPAIDFLKGDANKDGKVNAADARIVLRIAASIEKLEDYSITVAVVDMNDDSKVNAADARLLLRKAAGIIE